MSLPRPLRYTLIGLGAVVAIAAGAGAVAIARFDPDSLKPRIEEAVRRATGRDLALNGAIRLKLSLSPAVQVADVAFANPPGFSRPQMATVQGVELQLGLLPLLSGRYEINRLVLIHPDILLETDTAGQPNWRMTPEVSPGAPAGSQVPAAPGQKTKAVVSIDTVSIRDGVLAYRDDRTGKLTTLGLADLEATEAAPDAPLHVDAEAAYNGTAFTLAADTGPLTRLQDSAATSPWPVKLALSVAGAKLAAEGAVTQPLQAKGYDLAVSGSIPDLSALTPLLQGFVPPPLHDVGFAAKVADTGGAWPDIASLVLHAGASDLGAQVPGLTLAKLDIAAAAASQPAKADATGSFGGAPLTLAATFGPLASLLPGAAPAPFPVDATLQAAGATISAKGTVTDVRALSGANLALTAQIPDLAALSPLARRPLPALKTVAFQGTLTDAAGGFRNGAALHGLTLSSAEGDVTGDVSVGLGARQSLVAGLKSNRIDLDAIEAAFDAAPQAAASPPPSGDQPPPPPPPPKRADRLFSDQPLPFAVLRAADADIRLDIGLLRSGGADYRAIDTHAVLAIGKLAINPFSAETPGGRLSGTLAVDAGQPVPPVHLMLHAPGLALKSLLALLHVPSIASASLELRADISGAGETPHAIAASLDGYAGLAMSGGVIDNRLLGSLLGKVMDSLNALDLVGKGGSSELRCFAALIQARHGVATIQPLALSSSLLTTTGSGTVNLGGETLAMELRPQARLGGTAVVIPVSLAGPIRNPRVGVNKVGAAESNAGTVASAVLGGATPLGALGGLIGGNRLMTAGSADVCPAALAEARGQAAPAAEAPAEAAASAKQPKQVDPAALLKSLFR
nr:AsmA family protein [uncultured Rhodopila sp.]